MTCVRRLSEPAHLGAAEQLYADVFGRRLNHRLLVGIAANGGYVLGAYEDEDLVGYGLSFLARADGRLYQYSQTVAVTPSAQGRGIGRAIKYAQRDAALADDIDLIRWSFDPVHARNAHFNTDVLGGRITRLRKDFYGEGTDRFLVDWGLRAIAPPIEWDVPSLEPGHGKDLGDAMAIAIPTTPHHDLRETALFEEAFERGLVGASCRLLDEHTAVYLFVRP